MNKIPTAEEFLNNQNSYIQNKHIFLLGTGKIMQQNMIEFAKLHIEAALKAANERAKNCHIDEIINNEVLNTYPLENIK